MTNFQRASKRAFDFIFETTRWICIGLLATEVIVISYVVFTRYVLNYSPRGAQQFALICMVWFSMASCAIAVRDNIHVRLTVVDRLYSPRWRRGLAFVNHLLTFGFGLFMIFHGSRLVTATLRAMIPGLEWPIRVLYLPIPVAGVLFVVAVIEKAIQGTLFTWIPNKSES